MLYSAEVKAYTNVGPHSVQGHIEQNRETLTERSWGLLCPQEIIGAETKTTSVCAEIAGNAPEPSSALHPLHVWRIFLCS